MSTNVVRPATTSGSGRPSRFVGFAAGGLAVVIAIGVVFAVNQGNDVTGAPPAHPIVSDAHRAKAELLAERAAAAALSPGANIEKYRLEQASSIVGTQSPGANIEKYKLEQAGLLGAALDSAQTEYLEERLAHEFVEDQRSGSGTGQGNPLEGLAE